jgi:altronate dehydratase large subunit
MIYELKGKPFCKGFLRPDGRKGIRNKVLVIYTVECSKHVCLQIARQFENLKYDVDCVGNESCAYNDVVFNQLLSFCTHPNVGAVLAIGMGCESISSQKIRDYARANHRLAQSLDLQKVGGTQKGIRYGLELAEKMAAKLIRQEKVPVFLSELIIGAECGSSDYTSGLAGNPLVGNLFDLLADHGGTAIAEELHEALGLKDFLVSRGVDDQARREISAAYEKTIRYCKAVGRLSISPGNFDGGLSTIEEKSLGAVAKTGKRMVQGILKVAQKPKRSGIWLLDIAPDYEPARNVYFGGDASSMMNLVASGCSLLLLVTGRGHVAGTPISPVIKITANQHTFDMMSDDIDFCAADLLTGKEPVESTLERLVDYIAQVCEGKCTSAERNHNTTVTLPFNFQNSECVLEEYYY